MVLERETVEAAPVPVKLTVCGLLAALSIIFRVAARAPEAVGLKVTLIVQLAPAFTAGTQLSVSEKSPGFAPVKAMLLIARVTVDELVRVMG